MSSECPSTSIKWCYIWDIGFDSLCSFTVTFKEETSYCAWQRPLEQDTWLLRSCWGWTCCSLYTFVHSVLLCWMTCCLVCDFFVLQLPEALQGDENQGSAFVVQADPQRPPLLAHQSSAHHSQRPEMRQHLHHGAHGLGEDRGPGFSHAEEGLLCQECHR